MHVQWHNVELQLPAARSDALLDLPHTLKRYSNKGISEGRATLGRSCYDWPGWRSSSLCDITKGCFSRPVSFTRKYMGCTLGCENVQMNENYEKRVGHTHLSSSLSRFNLSKSLSFLTCMGALGTNQAAMNLHMTTTCCKQTERELYARNEMCSVRFTFPMIEMCKEIWRF